MHWLVSITLHLHTCETITVIEPDLGLHLKRGQPLNKGRVIIPYVAARNRTSDSGHLKRGQPLNKGQVVIALKCIF